MAATSIGPNGLADIPRAIQVLEIEHPTQVAAATATGWVAEAAVLYIPFRCQVLAVVNVPTANQGGDDTNYKTLSIINVEDGDDGTDVVASLDLLAAAAHNARIPKAFTLSTTAADLILLEGEVLALKQTKVANGVDVEAGKVQIMVRPLGPA